MNPSLQTKGSGKYLFEPQPTLCFIINPACQFTFPLTKKRHKSFKNIFNAGNSTNNRWKSFPRRKKSARKRKTSFSLPKREKRKDKRGSNAQKLEKQEDIEKKADKNHDFNTKTCISMTKKANYTVLQRFHHGENDFHLLFVEFPALEMFSKDLYLSPLAPISESACPVE